MKLILMLSLLFIVSCAKDNERNDVLDISGTWVQLDAVAGEQIVNVITIDQDGNVVNQTPSLLAKKYKEAGLIGKLQNISPQSYVLSTVFDELWNLVLTSTNIIEVTMESGGGFLLRRSSAEEAEKIISMNKQVYKNKGAYNEVI